MASTALDRDHGPKETPEALSPRLNVGAILFVGLLDNMGPGDGTIYEIKQATHRYYIKIDPAQASAPILFSIAKRRPELLGRRREGASQHRSS